MDLNDLIEIGKRDVAKRRAVRVQCCSAAGCLACGAKGLKEQLREAIQESGVSDRVEVTSVGCLGLCSHGPLIRTEPDGALYGHVTPGDVPALVSELSGGASSMTRVDTGQPFFARQLPIVLENIGRIDPDRIEDYIAVGGYRSLHTALYEMLPLDVVDTITASGLRGRGGAGYPTGLKWSSVAKTPSHRRIVVCNADEGDPGAFMDRGVLEGDPHRVLEGMAIAGYAVGADRGYIYIRGEYPLAIGHLRTALRQANSLGVLGSQIFDSTFNFRIYIRIGAGAYVCGEETALIRSIEGGRGTPRPRPPYPAQRGLWGHPTLINNVETFANVPAIIRRGADWFAGIGTAKSKGTKVFSLSGKVRNTGLVEVPMGTPLRTIVEEMGVVPEGHRITAVQTGGPAGGFIPADMLDTPVDYESMTGAGSMMGSGGMVVIDSENDIVDVARFFMRFCMNESCGKCVPCRTGTVQIYRQLTKILEARASADDISMLMSLCEMVKSTSLCGLGQSAPNPVLSSLRHFAGEYEKKLIGGHAG
ncbi:MAG: NADH-ubiquinone oxidoreductase-F iron-sulfur binding region domain-containing protein [Capsulimonadaceae bacterium]